ATLSPPPRLGVQRSPLRRGQQRVLVDRKLLVEPAAETRAGRQRGESLETRQFGGEAVDDPLDEKIAEADAGQSLLAVRDRIEDGGIGARRVAERRALVEQRGDAFGNPAGQRDLDEDQRLIGHARVKEGEAAAIRLETVLEI